MEGKINEGKVYIGHCSNKREHVKRSSANTAASRDDEDHEATQSKIELIILLYCGSVWFTDENNVTNILFYNLFF